MTEGGGKHFYREVCKIMVTWMAHSKLKRKADDLDDLMERLRRHRQSGSFDIRGGCDLCGAIRLKSWPLQLLSCTKCYKQMVHCPDEKCVVGDIRPTPSDALVCEKCVARTDVCGQCMVGKISCSLCGIILCRHCRSSGHEWNNGTRVCSEVCLQSFISAKRQRTENEGEKE